MPHKYPKGEVFSVSEDEADYNFWIQVLVGDNVDNIKGIKGIGPKKAQKILENSTTNYDRYHDCLMAYQQAGMDYYDLLENATLLWIQREPNQYWMPPL